LESLHNAGRIACKDLKKQKIYMARQDSFVVPDTSKVASMEAEIKALAAEAAALASQNKSLSQELQHLNNQISNAELVTDIEHRAKEVAALEARVQELEGGTTLIDEAQIARITALYDSTRAAWRKRKRMAMDMVNAICGDNRRPKELMEEIGIETDEEMQVTLEGTELATKKTKR